MAAALLLTRRPARRSRPTSRRSSATPSRRRPRRRAVQAASLDVPIIVCLSGDFRIAFDRAARPRRPVASFASGLHPGFVAIDVGRRRRLRPDRLHPARRPPRPRPADGRLAGRLVPLDDLPPHRPRRPPRRLPATGRRPPRLRRGLGRAPHRRRPRRQDRGGPRRHRGLPPAAPAATARRASPPSPTASAGAASASPPASASEFGLAPKPLARIRRFRRAGGLAAEWRPADWADIAAACGYADQPHLVREFRRPRRPAPPPPGPPPRLRNKSSRPAAAPAR